MDSEMEILQLKAKVNEFIKIFTDFLRSYVPESKRIKIELETTKELLQLTHKEIELQNIDNRLKDYNYFS